MLDNCLKASAYFLSASRLDRCQVRELSHLFSKFSDNVYFLNDAPLLCR